MSEPTITRLELPEEVDLHIEIANVGSRLLALALDMSICGGVLVSLALAQHLFPAFSGGNTFKDWEFGSVVILNYLVWFGVNWVYFNFFEWWWNGQTPGKRVCGLRVIKADGSPVSGGDVFMRNLARPIDTFSPLVVLGVLMIFFSRKGQRLGDLMAQTLVIRETEIDWSQFDEPVFNEVSSENRVQPVGTLRLTPRQWEMVQGFLYRREGLEPAARSRVADRLCAELKNVVQGTDLETLALPPEEWLAEVIRRG